MNRIRFAMGALVLVLGLGYLIVTASRQSQATQMTAPELVQRAGGEDMADTRIQLAGQVVPGSIRWDDYRHRARFRIGEGGVEVPVVYTGSAVLPDTFDEGAPVVVEGYYRAAKGIFDANVVMAKCPSKYEGQSYRGHAAATDGNG